MTHQSHPNFDTEAWLFQYKDEGLDESDLRAFAAELKLLPATDKVTYVEAVQRCPGLLRSESNPGLFLKFHDNNFSDAAKRFVLYWQWRGRLFRERCFLPMSGDISDTDHHALSPEDVQLYNRGFVRILPCDQNDREVLFLDPTISEHEPHERRNRVGFYSGFLIMRNHLSATEGFQTIVKLDSTALLRSYAQNGKMTREAFPMRMLKTHLVTAFSAEEDEKDFCNSFWPMMVSSYGAAVIRHSGAEADFEDTLANFAANGILSKNLPPCLFGVLESTTVDCNAQKYMKATAVEKRYAEISRQKRQRRKLKDLSLIEERDRLERERAFLQAENARLNRLLQQAHRILMTNGTLGQATSPANF